jgi:hypothetical protein
VEADAVSLAEFAVVATIEFVEDLAVPGICEAARPPPDVNGLAGPGGADAGSDELPHLVGAVGEFFNEERGRELGDIREQ